MKKALSTTVDFLDELILAGRMYTADNIRQMLTHLATLGITRIDWVIDGRDKQRTLHAMPFGDKANVLEYVVEQAHAMNIEVHAQFKPFETGAIRYVPHCFPQPAGVPLLRDSRGIYWDMDSFAIEHPHMRLRRKPGQWNPGGAIGGIKLVNQDATPCQINLAEIEIWVGMQNGELTRCDQIFQAGESVEWRSVFPVAKPCRVLSLEGLSIDESFRFIHVRHPKTIAQGSFGNTINELMEIYDTAGRLIPSSPAADKGWDLWATMRLSRFPMNTMCRYGRSKELQTFFSNEDAVQAAYRDFYAYDVSQNNPLKFLNEDGYAGVARGKSEYIGGALNPVHPEVREYWLGLVRQYIAWGIDGVNFRVSNHSCPTEDRDDFGLNESVLNQGENRIDLDLVNKINGTAYTDFLRAAAAELRRHGLCTSVDIHAGFAYPGDMGNQQFWAKMPPNFAWQCETWIREIADVVYLKGLHTVTQPHADHFIDTYTRLARQCGKQTVYVSTNSELSFSGNYAKVESEMNTVLRHDRIDGYNLYETASYMRLAESGTVELSPELERLVRQYFHG